MLDFLPKNLQRALEKIENLNEVKIRVNSPVKYTAKSGEGFLKDFVYKKDDLYRFLVLGSNGSIYSKENDIKNGFITVDGGIRVGIAGEFVTQNGEVSGVKSVHSLTIRFPSDVKGVSSVFSSFYKGGSVLVVSRSGVGKTTFLRDFTRFLSNDCNKNVTVVDERNEIGAYSCDNPFDLGVNADVLTYVSKSYGFLQGVRTLNPNVIVTDELTSLSDTSAVLSAIYSGVDVVASVHANSVLELKNKPILSQIIDEKVFNYYVLITKNGLRRTYTCYDVDLNEICKY
ncbi:MAG: hypothetical protein IKL82_03990 [Clostridia bacterium]|nr:hypothetical protein [Clostridia bacterium]